MKTSCLILVLWTSISLSNAQLIEDFSSGNLMQPTLWQGTVSYFTINAVQQLQSNGPAASSTLYLQTASSALHNTLWQCWLKMDFSSSTTNYTKMVLAASSANLLDPNLEAYYVKIGGLTGTTDGIDLYYQQGATHTRIIKGIAGRAGATVVEVRLQICSDAMGNWSLYSDTTGAHNFQMEGTAKHVASFVPQAFGLMCIHSSTRRTKFYFDDFIVDNNPFFFSQVLAITKQSLQLTFNQIPITLGNKNNVLLDGTPLGSLDQVEVKGNQVFIHLAKPLVQGKHKLYVPPLTSATGDALANFGTVDFDYVRAVQHGELLFSELMSDPDPAIGLPPAEYVEVYNVTNDTLWLEGFQFSDLNTKVVLPQYNLAPKQRLILSSTTHATALSAYGNCIGLSPWPSLNNDADTLFLSDAAGALIDQVAYTTRLLTDEKKGGGWSLELIHPEEQCKGFANWDYSEAPQGGTPGVLNSIASRAFDRKAPTLVSSVFLTDQTAQLVFDEVLDTTTLPTITRLDTEESGLLSCFRGGQQLEVKLPLEEGKSVWIAVQGLKDCSGNTQVLELEVQHPKRLEIGDLALSEVLFNPYPYGSDFVELYNKTEAWISLEGLTIQNQDEKQTILKGGLMSPHAYKVISADSMEVKSFYPQAVFGTFIKAALPVFLDTSGSVRLLNVKGETLDFMSFSEDMHHPFLEDKEGISLERVSLEQSSELSSNWVSASIQSHGASPGYRNTQSGKGTPGGTFEIVPRSIAPGTDGYRNYACIYYQTAKAGTSVRADMYTMDGNWVRALQGAGPTDVKGMCTWDGTNDKMEVVATGLYVLVLEFSHPEGDHYKLKGTIAVLSR